MASVFRRGRSDIWIAAIRAWDAKAGSWRWIQKSTGTTDRAKASGIAVRLEQASGAAQAGQMTRAKALALVNDILTLAGLDAVAPIPPLKQVAMELQGTDVSDSTARKYRAQWAALEAWAGAKVDVPVDAWTTSDASSYYQFARNRYSTTTANDHLRFLSMIFERAVRHGHMNANPVANVDTVSNDTIERETFTRSHAAAILKECRRTGRKDWTALVALGWHTGHRLQDLLDVTAASIDGDLLSIQPRKKGKKGRTVILPLPAWLAKRIVALRDFQTIHGADNRNGRVSAQFIDIMRAAGVDPLPVDRGMRTIHRRSFHSFRHSMASRLTAAGVSGEIARLVTDHESPKVHRGYVHAEIQSLRLALREARRSPSMALNSRSMSRSTQ